MKIFSYFMKCSIVNVRAMSSSSSQQLSLKLHNLTGNISLLSSRGQLDGTRINYDRPIVIMMSWMLGKQQHLSKYAEIYTDKGCDVLTVKINPSQLLWPKSGSQLVAKDLAKLLENVNVPLLVHGFSVGAYVWTEALLHLGENHPVLKLIQGQIWDSGADFTAMSHGLPYAMFPRNPPVRVLLQSYIFMHKTLFYYSSIVHYEKARNYFFDGHVKAPALLFVSENDLIGTVAMNRKLKDSWTEHGIPVEWKCWKKSAHVRHMIHHPEEYMTTLNNFLNSINFPPVPKSKL